METPNTTPGPDPNQELINSEMVSRVNIESDQEFKDRYDASSLVADAITDPQDSFTGESTIADTPGSDRDYRVSRSYSEDGKTITSVNVQYVKREQAGSGKPSAFAEFKLFGNGDISEPLAVKNDGTKDSPWELSKRDAINIAAEAMANVREANQQQRRAAGSDKLAA